MKLLNLIKIDSVLLFALATILCSFTDQAVTTPGSSDYKKSKGAESITIVELRDHVFFLASDSMKGRETGSQEYLAAASYCAGQFIMAGITPYDSMAKGEAAYFQDVPYRSINYVTGRIPVIGVNEKGLKYENGLNFKITSAGDTGGGNNILPVVFVGYGVSAKEYGWDDFEGLDLEGKAVLVLTSKPPSAWSDKIPLKKRERLMDYRRNISRLKAAVIVEFAESEWMLKNWSYGDGLKPYSFIVKDPHESKGERISSSSPFYVKADIGRSLFENQPFNPARQIAQGQNEYQTFELQGVGLDTADYTNHKPIFAPNVIGFIRGTDPVLAKEYVVVGAHLDHVGPGYNGADDNASGCAGILEIAEALTMDPPKRSVILVLFSGEEKGLLGSKFFIDNCPVPLKSITGMINLDMIGRTAPENQKDRAHYICNIEWQSDSLLRCVEEVNATTYQWPLKRLISAGSDHARFARKGIPSVFFFSGAHKDLHEKTDDPEKIDYEKMQVISQLAYEVANQLANK